MAAIPPNLEPAILEKAAAGASTRDVSQWLLETHGVTASYKAVQRLLSRTRVERASVAKAIVQEKLSKTVLSDIDALELRIARLEKHAAKLDAMADGEALTASAYLALVEELRKVTETLGKQTEIKLHFSGADVPDDANDADSLAEHAFISRMAGLADRLRKAGVVRASVEGGSEGP